MPFVSDPQQLAPKQGHFAITVDESGEAMAVGKGNHMTVIEDPTRMDRFFPMIIQKVTVKEFQFRCACGNPQCTLTYIYRGSRVGFHPPKK